MMGDAFEDAALRYETPNTVPSAIDGSDVWTGVNLSCCRR